MAESRVRLRAAEPDDVPLLCAWDEDDAVAASSGDDDTFDWAQEVPRQVPWRELLIAEIPEGAGYRPIGSIQIIDAREEETHYWGDVAPGHKAIDIWIGSDADRNKGYGAQMMRLAFGRCFADPATHTILIDPLARNSGAIRFYERLGFEPEGPRRFGEDACLVLKLTRERWEQRQGA